MIYLFVVFHRVQVVSRQKLNSHQENIDVFSIAIEFLTTNDLGLGTSIPTLKDELPKRPCATPAELEHPKPIKLAAKKDLLT